jgi:leader peptidase (prepilin peptidase)/N-methyltransferase|tara:strand:+ start:475 stop:1239 length:765 start_codon:yes stop_codon:yes gene_type:complete
VDFLIIIVLGAIWGSFANVCIYRLPKNKEIIIQNSFCPNCKKKIHWFDNIPILSFIFLWGRCRKCNKLISLRYLIVEFLGAISFLFIYLNFGLTITTLLLMILAIFCIIIFFIDLKYFIIPDSLTFPLMIIGFVKSFDPNLNTSIFPNYINSLIGGIFGYLIIWLIIYFYKKIRRKEGMGLGDAKLLAAMGFWFGWAGIPFIIFISSSVALILTIPSLVNQTRKMSSKIPFGPHIIVGSILYILFSNQIKMLLL